jgi:hypothetical protein
LKAVSEAGMGVDEAPIGHGGFELGAQLGDVDVDRTVPGAQLTAPHDAVELLARYDCADALGHCHQQLELAHRQGERVTTGERQALGWPDLELPGVQRAAVLVGFLHKLTESGSRRPRELRTGDPFVKSS